VLQVLDAEEVADELVGFHCQQAAEKLLKAVLAARGVAFRRTHDLAELLDAVGDAGLDLPPALAGLDNLTPFAVDYRYDLMDGGGALERSHAAQMVRDLRTWVIAILARADSDREAGRADSQGDTGGRI